MIRDCSRDRERERGVGVRMMHNLGRFGPSRWVRCRRGPMLSTLNRDLEMIGSRERWLECLKVTQSSIKPICSSSKSTRLNSKTCRLKMATKKKRPTTTRTTILQLCILALVSINFIAHQTNICSASESSPSSGESTIQADPSPGGPKSPKLTKRAIWVHEGADFGPRKRPAEQQINSIATESK